MIDIVLDEITRRTLLAGAPINDSACAPITEILCLGVTLDLGPLACGIFSEERRDYLKSLYGSDMHVPNSLDTFFPSGLREYETLQSAILRRDDVRVWTCDMAFSVCGFALLCSLLEDSDCRLYQVSFPQNQTDPTSTFRYGHWGMLTPEKCIVHAPKAQLVEHPRRSEDARLWAQLTRENANLRVWRDGTVYSVEDTYYDDAIRACIAKGITDTKQVFSTLVREFPAYIHYEWCAHRLSLLLK